MKKRNSFWIKNAITCVMALLILGCSKDTPTVTDDDGVVTPTPEPEPEPEPAPAPLYTVDNITDTYLNVAGEENSSQWGPYNVHDPSVLKVGDTYYCYNTDVSYGSDVRPGIQIRKSKNLINWEFIGWAFSGLPPKGSAFIRGEGTEPFNSLWAPFIMKVDSEYRLYYSLSSSSPRLSVIGLATASNPEGPWTERDLVVTSLANGTIQTNAIDPTVVVTPTGEHWFYYGSAWDGIYKLRLDPATGLALNTGDKGTRIAQRGFTDGSVNGNIEGAEVIFNEEQGKYYMFLSYDWLQTKYNVRVGRSDSPSGPFYDYNGLDINTEADNIPMILAPYRFSGHSGWQGVSHPGVFKDDLGQYYMAHQGRPGEDSFYMVLHIRKMHWTEDGWPIVSPERFANVVQSTFTPADLVGNYQYITLGYRVVPGYADEQQYADFQISLDLELSADGSINQDVNNSWTYETPWLTLDFNNGERIDKVYVDRGRDWENKVETTVLFSGLNTEGTAIWGKKMD